MANKIMLIASLCLLTACGAGSGEGLNDQGLPIPDENGNGDNEPEAGVTLTQLQTNIFTPICSVCHSGGSAPHGLRLDSEDNSYAFLVDRPAEGIPELMRVNPGQAEQSYIVHKLEGAASIVGGRMPLGGPYLSQEQINQVRDWIANGAPRSGTGSGSTKVSAVSVQKVVNTVQAELGSTVHAELRFSRPIQFSTIAEEAVDVFYTVENSTASIRIETFALLLADQTLHITVNQLPPDATQLEIIINNTDLQAVLDENNRQLDGNNNNDEGGVYRYVYDI